MTPSAAGALRIDQILAWSNDTADQTLNLQVNQSGNAATIVSAKITALSGIDPLPIADLLTPYLPATMDGLILPAGTNLLGQMVAAVTAGKVIFVMFFGGYL